MIMSKLMLNIVPDNMDAADIVHVSVAVIVKNGRVLLSKRAKHVHQGGLWEFPGGKVEDGETVTAALYREVREELGIHITTSRPLISLLHRYPDKSVLLETRLVTAFDGKDYDQSMTQSGLEGQEVKWVAIEKLSEHQFPAANKAIINAVQLPERYVITPDRFIPGRADPDQGEIERFMQEFAETIRHQHLLQLRIKSLNAERLNQLARRVCDMAQENHTRVLLNSAMRIDEAIQQQASGIHLTSEHLHDSHFVECYQKLYPEKIIAVSCHNEDDILRANQLPVDFSVISPVQHTASHPEQEPLGWSKFKRLVDLSTVPVFALGGMAEKDMALAQEQGAQGIAAIRGLWAKPHGKDNNPVL